MRHEIDRDMAVPPPRIADRDRDPVAREGEGDAMTKPWITTNRDRKSAKYVALHAQLAKEVGESPRPSLAGKSPKQVRKFAKSELHRMYGDAP